MKFASGAAAHIQVNWMHPFKEQRLVVMSCNATAIFEDSAVDRDDKLFGRSRDGSGLLAVACLLGTGIYLQYGRNGKLCHLRSSFSEC